MKGLKIGDKVYRPAWKLDGVPFICEEEIVDCKHMDGGVNLYFTKNAGVFRQGDRQKLVHHKR